MHPLVPQKEWLRNSQQQPGYNLYIYSGQDLQCLTKLQCFIKLPKIEKIRTKNHNGFRRNRSPTSRMLTISQILGVRTKKSGATILFIEFSRVIWLQTLREDGANTSRLRSTQRNRRSRNDAFKKKQSKSPLTDEDWLFRHSSRYTSWRHISLYLFIICQDYVLNVNRFNKRKRFKAGKQMIPCINNYGRRLRRWYTTYSKYTCPSQIPATLSGTSCRRYRPLCKRR